MKYSLSGYRLIFFGAMRNAAAVRENHLHLCGCRSAVARPAAYRGKVRTACSNARLIRYGSGVRSQAALQDLEQVKPQGNEKKKKKNTPKRRHFVGVRAQKTL